MERPSKLGRLMDRYGLWVGIAAAVLLFGAGELFNSYVGPIVNAKLDEINERFRSSGCFQAGWKALLSNAEATNWLGDEIQTRAQILGKMPLNRVQGKANFQVRVEGSQSQAWLAIKCEAENGEWQLESVLLTGQTDDTRIRLFP